MYIANLTPVLVSKLPLLAVPIDGGKMWRGYRLLGDNKTWRGLIFGSCVGTLVASLQFYGYHHIDVLQNISIYNYKGMGTTVLLGFLLSFGALLGDALKSLVKRQLNRPSGSAWPPFDQLDFIVIGLLLTSTYYWPGYQVALTLIVITPLLHWLTNLLGYKLGLKNVPW